jgi:hypothetical protein
MQSRLGYSHIPGFLLGVAVILGLEPTLAGRVVPGTATRSIGIDTTPLTARASSSAFLMDLQVFSISIGYTQLMGRLSTCTMEIADSGDHPETESGPPTAETRSPPCGGSISVSGCV